MTSDASAECSTRTTRRYCASAVRRCPRVSQAEDIVAEVFEIAWRRLETIDEGHERAWLYATARNVLANHRRRGQREPHLVDVSPLLDIQPSAAGLVDETDRLRRAMTHLSSRDRDVLALAAWEQLDPAEAAEVLGCSPVTYRVRLHRARNRLQAVLDQRPRAATTRKATR